MNQSTSVRTLGEVLVGRRRRRFVGREEEIGLFRAVLADPAAAVLFIHGPGGIGKSTLLGVYADLAAAASAAAVRFDGRDLMASPATLLEVLRPILDRRGGPRVVVLLDSYERMSGLDDWLRTRVLPRLPADALVVIAGRAAPSPAWLTDPGWRDLVRTVPLRNLRPRESLQYLLESGVAEDARQRLVELSHGHPLGLALLAEVTLRGGLVADPMAPDLVRRLLGCLLDTVPSPRHRRAVEVAALARVTTEALLREALDESDGPHAHELFEWLRDLSFVESGPDGLFPHDLAREALDTDLRWRDPDAYRRAFRGVRSHVAARLRTVKGRAQQAAVFDEKFLLRHQPDIMAHLDWDSLGQHYPQPAGPDDEAAILELVQRWEGARSAAIARHWFQRQLRGFFVVRHQDRSLRGFVALLDLSAASPQDISADPGARAVWDYARRNRPPRTGEVVTQTRFLIDAVAHQRPSPTINIGPMLSIQHWLNTPRLAWDFITLLNPYQWDDYFNFSGLPRAAGAEFDLDGRQYGSFAIDLRRQPVEAWLEMVTERALARDFTPTPPAAPGDPLLVLSQPEFAQAVRRALRDLTRPDQLAHSPLLRSRVVRARCQEGREVAALGDAVRDAIERLRGNPRDEKLYHALNRTYLRPAGSQERAAEVLDLPLSTYKRHLRRGVDRVVADLWHQELTS